MLTKAEVLKALDGSIAKWKRIVRSCKTADRGRDDCPLCALFLRDCCWGEFLCPVATASHEDCYLSPYCLWSYHQRHEHDRHLKGLWNRVPHCKRCLRLARLELQFLEDVRDAYTKGGNRAVTRLRDKWRKIVEENR